MLALTGEPGATTAAGGMVGHCASGAGGACAPRYWCIRPAVAAATARPLAVPPVPSPPLANNPAARTGAWLFPSPRPASPHCVSYSSRQGLVFVLSSSPALPTSLRLSSQSTRLCGYCPSRLTVTSKAGRQASYPQAPPLIGRGSDLLALWPIRGQLCAADSLPPPNRGGCKTRWAHWSVSLWWPSLSSPRWR